MIIRPLMKSVVLPILLAFSLFVSSACGQGTFEYDQQSSDENTPGESVIGIQPFQPMGQSFTPSLPAVGFVRLQLLDGNPANGLGATIYVNLLADSIDGQVLASSDPVSLPDGYPGDNNVGFVDFIFATNVPVNPNVTYYFRPMIAAGDGFLAGRFIPVSDYTGGTEYVNGLPGTDDLWFREGIVVPEPSILPILLIGGFVGWLVRNKMIRRTHE